MVKYQIDESLLDEQIPPLTLQPIVENAINHGLNDMEENCILNLMVKDAGQDIVIVVEDNGKGIPEAQIRLLGLKQMHSDTGAGIGLYNVNRRLKIMFGDQAELSIKSEMNKGTIVIFRIPKSRVR